MGKPNRVPMTIDNRRCGQASSLVGMRQQTWSLRTVSGITFRCKRPQIPCAKVSIARISFMDSNKNAFVVVFDIGMKHAIQL